MDNRAGGTDHHDNLGLACKPCNSGKAGRTPELAGMIASIKAKRSHKTRAGSSPLNTGVTQRINNKASGPNIPIEPHKISAALAEFNAAIPDEQKVTIIGLAENVCHWPLWTDEDRSGFYCGGQVMDGHRVYCREHSRFGGAGYARERGYGFKRSVNTYR
jgi:hypothetical protein